MPDPTSIFQLIIKLPSTPILTSPQSTQSPATATHAARRCRGAATLPVHALQGKTSSLFCLRGSIPIRSWSLRQTWRGSVLNCCFIVRPFPGADSRRKSRENPAADRGPCLNLCLCRKIIQNYRVRRKTQMRSSVSQPFLKLADGGTDAARAEPCQPVGAGINFGLEQAAQPPFANLALKQTRR